MSAVAARRAAAVRALPWAVVAIAAATIAVGLGLRLAAHVELGTPLPPFLLSWLPAARTTALPGIAVAAALVALAPIAVDRVRPAPVFAVVVYGATLALGLAVNVARRGTGGWDHVFVLGRGGAAEAHFEYLPALAWLHGGVANYVRSYPRLLPYLPTHTKGNPPGPLVAMQLLSITTPGRLAAACVLLGALAAPLTYGLGRTLGGDRCGRVAAALTAFSPCVVLFGVTSVDYVFVAFAAGAAWLLVGRGTPVRLAGCLLAAVASFFSWVLLAVPVWAVLVLWRREGTRAAVTLAIAAAATLAAFTGLLAAVWGYDPFSILRASSRIYGAGAAAHRPYAFWLFGSPAAWLALLGPPIAWLWLRALARGEAAALALAVVVLVSAVAGFTKAETERIWLPYVPLAAVAAASVLGRRLWLALAVMAAEAIAVEILFQTVW